MALSRSRLELLLRMAERREADARSAVAEAQRRLDTQQSIDRELRSYRDDYETRGFARPSPLMLENRRQFLGRLGAAIEAQQAQIAQAAEQLRQAQARWLEQRQALQVAETMLEQGLVRERAEQERRAQREMDEFAGRRPLRAGFAP